MYRRFSKVTTWPDNVRLQNACHELSNRLHSDASEPKNKYIMALGVTPNQNIGSRALGWNSSHCLTVFRSVSQTSHSGEYCSADAVRPAPESNLATPPLILIATGSKVKPNDPWTHFQMFPRKKNKQLFALCILNANARTPVYHRLIINDQHKSQWRWVLKGGGVKLKCRSAYCEECTFSGVTTPESKKWPLM